MFSASSLMEQARRALREERPDDAQAFLINIVATNPRDDEAWMLLADTFSDLDKKRECLERARVINPLNRTIARALEQLNGSASTPAQVQEQKKSDGQPLATVAAKAEVPKSKATSADSSSPSAPIASATPPKPSPAPEMAPAPPPTQSNPRKTAPVRPNPPAESVPAMVEPLLDYGELMAQAIVMTTEPEDALNIGFELVKLLDQVAARDAAQTRQWARAAGHSALVKYEKVLSRLIANLPRGDTQLSELLSQRQRALNYLK